MTARILVALTAVLIAAPALAQTNVGVVDFDAVFRESTRAKSVFADVEAFRQAKQAELSSAKQAYDDKLRNLQNGVGLSESERADLTRELRDQQTRLARMQEDAEREGQRMTSQALAVLDKQLGPLVREVARERGLQLILQSTPEIGIVFADPAIDVTADIIAKLDAAAPAPSAQ